MKHKRPLSPLNLQCRKSIEKHLHDSNFPKKYDKLQPTIEWCESTSKFANWISLTKEQQYQEKDKWRKHSKKVKEDFKQKVQGEKVAHCSCAGCTRKPRKGRTDVGLKRKRISLSGRKKKVDDIDAYPKFVSMGLGRNDRDEVIIGCELHDAHASRRKRGRKQFDAGESAKNVAQSFDGGTRKAL